MVGCEFRPTLTITNSPEGYVVRPSEDWIQQRIGNEVPLVGLDFEGVRRVCSRVYALLRSMPDTPLEVFLGRTRSMPRQTEAERTAVVRIGQGIFRDALMDFWGGRCPLTGVADGALLRASHIILWSECETDADRLDAFNGILLSAHVDAAFDRHLLSFDQGGALVFSPALSERAREMIRSTATVDRIP